MADEGNSYKKTDIRLLNKYGLVIGVHPEGLAEGVFANLTNTKTYRQGSIGLRDQRDLFAGLKTTDLSGRNLWFSHLTRFNNEYVLGFSYKDLHVWRWKIPDPAFSGTQDTPKVKSEMSFTGFLPEGSIPSTVSVLPAQRSIPVTYFTKPGVTRMWKLVVGNRTSTPPKSETPPDSGPIEKTLLPPDEVADLRVYYWGIPAPSGRISVDSTLIAGKLTASTVSGSQVYDYVYTLVNPETGHEGNPSAGLVTTFQPSVADKGARLYIPIDTGGDNQVGSVRIYRKGGLSPAFKRVAEASLAQDTSVIVTGQPPGTIYYDDTKSDTELDLAPELKIDNYVPFVSTNQNGDAVYNSVCPFIFGPYADRVILGIGEANQPGNVFWTNAGRPDSSSPTCNVQVTSSRDPLVTGLIYNGTAYVASRGDWYALDFSTNASTSAAEFAPRRTRAGRGPIGPWAACSGTYIYFITHDGVMQTDGQSEAVSITSDLDPIFHNQTVNEFLPIDFTSAQELFRLFWAGPELHFLYPDTAGAIQHLIYDGKWRVEEFARPGRCVSYPNEPWTYSPLMQATALYWDSAWPSRSILYGTTQRAIFIQRHYQSSGIETAKFTYDPAGGTWQDQSTAGWVLGHFRTHTDDAGSPAMLKEFGNVSFEASMANTSVINDATLAAYGTAQGALQETSFRGKSKLTLYATAESVTDITDSDIQPGNTTVGQPIGSDVYNAATTGRQKYVFGVSDLKQYVYSTAWDYQFYGPWNFHNMTVFWRNDTEVINHFHQCNLNFGKDGWLHVRDGYLDARLYGPATLSLSVDYENIGDNPHKGQTISLSPTFTLPDGTSADYTGLRHKYYLSFLPFKGKKFTWTLDCPLGMRLYQEGCEINAKQWVSSKGYDSVNPFATGAV